MIRSMASCYLDLYCVPPSYLLNDFEEEQFPESATLFILVRTDIERRQSTPPPPKAPPKIFR